MILNYLHFSTNTKKIACGNYETDGHWEILLLFLKHWWQMESASSRYYSLCLSKQTMLHFFLITHTSDGTAVRQYSLSVSLRLIIPGHSARMVSLNDVTRAFTQHSISCEDAHETKSHDKDKKETGSGSIQWDSSFFPLRATRNHFTLHSRLIQTRGFQSLRLWASPLPINI